MSTGELQLRAISPKTNNKEYVQQDVATKETLA